MHKKLTKSYSFSFLSIVSVSIGSLITLFLPTSLSAANCRLSLTMSPLKASILTTETASRKIVVKNTSSVICKATALSVYYEDNEIFISSLPSPRASNYYWYIGNLRPHKTYTITLLTKNNPQNEGAVLNLEGCASANNATDACTLSKVSLIEVGHDTSIGTTTTPVPATTTVSLPVTTGNVTIATTTTETLPLNSTTSMEQGMWIWKTPIEMNREAGVLQLKELQKYGFNALYITIDDYLDIARMPEGLAKEQAITKYSLALSQFIALANSLGMKVDAEGGANNWATPSLRSKGFTLIDFVVTYNKLYPATALRGFQYDVEPHTLSSYETNKEQVLKEYIEFIAQSVIRFGDSSATFSIVIPHFFDGAQAWTPKISYNGTTTSTFDHLLSVLEKKKESQIILMSYRDFFEGANGTREISEAELRDVAKGAYSTEIIVAQETGNVTPSYVTYYGTSKSKVFSALREINSGFTTYSSYGGTAVHYLDSFFDLP